MSIILAPEDDNSGHTDGPKHENATSPMPATMLHTFRIAFDPQRGGGGIRPWPGVGKPVGVSDSMEVAMKYLIEGKGQKDREE